jgi:predicted nucleotidyltransferase
LGGTDFKARIDKLLEVLRPYEPERVYLFGSAAREEADELSDLDLVVIKRTSLPFFERLREVAKLLPAGTGGVDVLVYTPEEFLRMQQEGNAFAELIAEEARLIYGGEEEG